MNCIASTNNINIDSLSKFSSFPLVIDNNPKYIYLSIARISSDLHEFNQVLIQLLGSAPIPKAASANAIVPVSFITRQNQILESTLYITETIFDSSIAVGLYNVTADFRNSPKLDISYRIEIEAKFRSLVNSNNVAFWQGMSLQQKQIVELLFAIREQLLAPFPMMIFVILALENCVVAPVRDCFLEFYRCQLQKNTFDAFTTSLETHAVLF